MYLTPLSREINLREGKMYAHLDKDTQLLLAIQFHLSNAVIPKELQELLGPELINDVLRVDS